MSDPTPAAATHTPPSSTSSPARTTIAARVTADITAALQHGVRPWQQPWNSATALALPLRANGIPYQGINILALWAASSKHDYTARHWLSFNQIRARGGAVRKGERATPIILYKPAAASVAAAPPRDTTAADTSAPAHRAVLRRYAVFNADQTDGLPLEFYAASSPPQSPPADTHDTHLDTVFACIPAHTTHGGNRACYNPTTDTIHLPPRATFSSTAQYYATRLHELAHWTGHPTRLHRDLQPHANRDAYAREELCAELTAAFLGAELGLPLDHIEDHAAYLHHWLVILDREPQALLTAAAQAQRAADFLRPFLTP